MEHDFSSIAREFGFILMYVITFLVSIFRYPRYFESILKYFPMIIGYTLISEIMGGYIRDNENFQIVFIEEHYINNSLIFNVFDIIFFSYFFYVFWKSIENKKWRKLIKYGSILFFISCVVNPFFENFILYPQTYAIIIGSSNLVLCTIFYLKQLKGVKVESPKKTNLLFWISIGLLIFYLAYPFLMIIGLHFSEIYLKYNVRQIHQLLICVMYTMFIIGFLKMHRMKPITK